jgi:hypothetical protein
MRTSPGLSKGELVNHPVRLQIIEAVGVRQLTPTQIAAAIPNVPQATLYRQIHALTDGGLLEVVAQRQAHGAVESTYAVRKGASHLSREEFAAFTPDEHMRCFALLAGAASAALERYLAQPGYDTTRDGMTYFAAQVQLSDADARQFRLDLLELIRNYGGSSGGGTRPRLITVGVFPEAKS